MKQELKIYTKITLITFLVVSIFGVILRFIPIYNGEIALNYQNILQTHSHLAFLGWVFNAIFILTLKQYPDILNNSKVFNHRVLFYLLQLFVILISISLLIWGYKHIAIISLSIHAYLTIVFGVKFIKYADNSQKGTYLLKLAFILMIISYLGTLCLGPISAIGLKYSDYYYSAIYFYLHFQYNGFFLFALFGFLINYYCKLGSHLVLPKKYINYFFISTLLTYSLSLLFTNLHNIINFIAFVSALIQIFIILKIYKLNKKIEFKYQDKISKYITFTTVIILLFKLCSQLVAPIYPELASGNRNLIIFFLHLNFLGIITPILLFLIDIYFIKNYLFRLYTYLLLIVFISSEILLFINSLNVFNVNTMYLLNFLNALLIYVLILFINISAINIKYFYHFVRVNYSISNLKFINGKSQTVK